MLEVVARRALAVTVVVAPPAQLVAPGSRAPNLTRPEMETRDHLLSVCFPPFAKSFSKHRPNGMLR